MTARAFTDEQEREILQMRALGIPTAEIVQEFGGRQNAVYSVFRRAGVPRRPAGRGRAVSDADSERIVQMYRAGQSVHAIGVALRRSPDAVRRQLRDHRIDQAGPAQHCQTCGSPLLILNDR